jgi:hypothetical protein
MAQSVFSSAATVIADAPSTRAGARESYISTFDSDYGGISDHTEWDREVDSGTSHLGGWRGSHISYFDGYYFFVFSFSATFIHGF